MNDTLKFKRETLGLFSAILIFLAGQTLAAFKWAVELQGNIQFIKDGILRNEQNIAVLFNDRYTGTMANKDFTIVQKRIDSLEDRMTNIEHRQYSK